MTRRIVRILGMTVLLMAPTLASAGQDWRSAWRQERGEIRRNLRDAARWQRRAMEDARRQLRLDRASRWRAERSLRAFRDEYRREYRNALRESQRALREAWRRWR